MPIIPARSTTAEQRDNLAAVILLAWAMTRPFNIDPIHLVDRWQALKDRLTLT